VNFISYLRICIALVLAVPVSSFGENSEGAASGALYFQARFIDCNWEINGTYSKGNSSKGNLVYTDNSGNKYKSIHFLRDYLEWGESLKLIREMYSNVNVYEAKFGKLGVAKKVTFKTNHPPRTISTMIRIEGAEAVIEFYEFSDQEFATISRQCVKSFSPVWKTVEEREGGDRGEEK